MLTLASAVAALAAVGWVATGGSGPGPAPSQVEDPSPSPSTTAGEDWVFFSGTVNNDAVSYTDGDPGHEEHGVWISTGWGRRGDVQETDDPRMSGTRSGAFDLISEAPDDSRANLGSALVTITNDEGAWTCPMTWIHFLTDRAAAGEIEQWAGWCQGSGGYEDLKAYLAVRQAEGSRGGDEEVYGFIFTGDGPPMPEAPAS
jgi:hypothetical protein